MEAGARRPLPRQRLFESSGTALLMKGALVSAPAHAAQSPSAKSRERAGWTGRPKLSTEKGKKVYQGTQARTLARHSSGAFRRRAPAPASAAQRWAQGYVGWITDCDLMIAIHLSVRFKFFHGVLAFLFAIGLVCYFLQRNYRSRVNQRHSVPEGQCSSL
jgi:hypothetical protein